jgi:hypothetical protein
VSLHPDQRDLIKLLAWLLGYWLVIAAVTGGLFYLLVWIGMKFI